MHFEFKDDKIVAAGGVAVKNKNECLKDVGIFGKMQCRVLAVAPIPTYFDSDKAKLPFTCAGGVEVGYYESSLPMYFACAVFKGDKLVKWKSRDLFKEKTGCPVWVIWLVIVIGVVFVAVLTSWCTCRCFCKKKRSKCCC